MKFKFSNPEGIGNNIETARSVLDQLKLERGKLAEDFGNVLTNAQQAKLKIFDREIIEVRNWIFNLLKKDV